MSSVEMLQQDERHFERGRLKFLRDFGPDVHSIVVEYPTFVIMKSREMLRAYEERLSQRHIENMLELGIMKGGSTAYFNESFLPRRHYAIDCYKHQHGLDDLAKQVRSDGRNFLAEYDVSQSATAEIIDRFERHFETPALFDLIIDDASHNYELSLASFNGLFPRMKPNGIYVIEDWGWAHWAGSYQEPANPEFMNPALSNLILYCVMACTAGAGGYPGRAGISRVDVTPDAVFIHRSEQEIPKDFAIQTAFPSRGRRFLPI